MYYNLAGKKVPQAAALINLLRKFSFVRRYAVAFVVFS